MNSNHWQQLKVFLEGYIFFIVSTYVFWKFGISDTLTCLFFVYIFNSGGLNNPEAVAQMWSVKKMFLEILQNLPKNTCTRASFFLQNTSCGCFCLLQYAILANILLVSHIFRCVKSVQIRSFFWSVFSCIQSEYRKIPTRKNCVFGLFSRSVAFTSLA